MSNQKNTFIFFLLFSLSFFIATPVMASFSWSWDEATGTLTINTNSTEGQDLSTIVSICSGGYVVINDAFWPRKPNNDYILPSEVKKIIINDGTGNDSIDLTYLTANGFPLLVDGTEPNVEVNLTEGNDFVRGSPLDDLLRFFSSGTITNPGQKIIFGEDGNDQITGGPGNDDLNGDDGNDHLIGGEGDDELTGGPGNDILEGTSGSNTLSGGDGDDDLTGGPGNDFLYGENGDDYLTAGEGNDVLEGGAGIDQLTGEDGNDQLRGGDGDDILNGGPGTDDLSGESGNDFLYGGDGNDVLLGGDDNDQLFGEAGEDYMHGNAGNDELWGSIGNDILEGGVGQDILQGNCDNDRILDVDNAQMFGGGGNDLFQPFDFLLSMKYSKTLMQNTTEIEDDSGIDTLSFIDYALGVTVNLDLLNVEQIIDANGNVINLKTKVESFIGSEYDDDITICPELDVELYVDGSPHSAGDVLNVNAMGEACSFDGVCVTTEGYLDINYIDIETVNLTNLTDISDADELPTEFSLHQNYPNPFNPSTIISYDIPETALVELIIYNSLGEEIGTLVNQEQSPGKYEVNFSFTGSASGVYFYKITAGHYSSSRKMLLLK